MGRAATDAPYAGYQRLAVANALAIIDTGQPAPFAASGQALAGCMAFELSHGRQRLFVNCGSPRASGRMIPLPLRATAAHTAATLGEASSCRFISRGTETRIADGPRKVTVARAQDAGGVTLTASHDGYHAQTGAIIHRMIGIDADGDSFTGSDRVDFGDARTPPGGSAGALIARFHLHTSVTPDLQPDHLSLRTERGGLWHFTSSGAHLALDESIYCAGIEGPRRTWQIVLTATDSSAGMAWRLDRIGPAQD